jgi:hypothetical protein
MNLVLLITWTLSGDPVVMHMPLDACNEVVKTISIVEAHCEPLPPATDAKVIVPYRDDAAFKWKYYNR